MSPQLGQKWCSKKHSIWTQFTTKAPREKVETALLGNFTSMRSHNKKSPPLTFVKHSALVNQGVDAGHKKSELK